MNGVLGLDAQTAESESSALKQRTGDACVIAWVGGAERPEFLRQSKALAERWAKAGSAMKLIVEPSFHHFDVIAALSSPDSQITQTLLED